MRTFDQSDKSKKTVDSMIVNKKEEKKAKGKENKPVKSKSNSHLMVCKLYRYQRNNLKLYFGRKFLHIALSLYDTIIFK